MKLDTSGSQLTRTALSAPCMSPPQVAEQLAVDPAKVLSWIRAGQLIAVNLAAPGKSRPRWRISADALRQFLEGRQCQPPAPKLRRRRAPKIMEFV